MRGVEIHARSASFVVGLKKPARAQAPSISLLKSLEAVCGRWGREIVSDVFRESEELRCHDRADRVAALIRVTGVAGRVSEKTGQRFTRTGLQRVTKYVDGGVHSQCHMIRLPLEPEHVESSGVFGSAILVWLTFEPLMFSPGITRRAIRATGRLSLADRGLRPPGRARPVRRRGGRQGGSRKNRGLGSEFRGIRRIGGHFAIRLGKCRLTPPHCENCSSAYANRTRVRDPAKPSDGRSSLPESFRFPSRAPRLGFGYRGRDGIFRGRFPSGGPGW